MLVSGLRLTFNTNRRKKKDSSCIKKNKIGLIYIFDGDNTLWDTNLIFTKAQKLVLSSLKEYGYPSDEEKHFQLLRKIDDIFINHFKKGEYDLKYLVIGLIYYFSNKNLNDLVEKVLEILTQKNSEIYSLSNLIATRFNDEIMKIPPLFKETMDTLISLRSCSYNVLIIHSEGDEIRIQNIIKTHNLANYVDHIYIGLKSIKTFRNLVKRGREILAAKEFFFDGIRIVVIGDNLEKEIKIGNSINAVTIYKPGGYKLYQTPKDDSQKPMFIVKSFKELRGIIESKIGAK